MEITSEQLMAEAAQMALELRLKDKALAQLEAENKQLRGQLADPSAPSGASRSGVS